MRVFTRLQAQWSFDSFKETAAQLRDVVLSSRIDESTVDVIRAATALLLPR